MTTVAPRPTGTRLVDRFERGLDAPICLTWELTYACNLACVHCLSSSGRRDPRELSTEECKALIDEFERMQIFYVNIGGGEPTIRSDFWDLVDYATEHHVGVKFSTNGSRITEAVAARLAASDYVDVQISLDGATAEVNDAVRGDGSFATAVTAMERLAGRRLHRLQALGGGHPPQRRPARRTSRPSPTATAPNCGSPGSGRPAGAPTCGTSSTRRPIQQRQLYDWLVVRGEEVLTGDSFFHLAGYGDALPGLNLCGAGRVVCLVDPVGDVYACPFAIHDEFLAGNVRDAGGFTSVWRESDLFRRAPGSRRAPAPVARAATTTPAGVAAWPPSSSPGSRSTGPTPSACSATASTPSTPVATSRDPDARRPTTRPGPGRWPVALTAPRAADRVRTGAPERRPDRNCDENPLAGFVPAPGPPTR